MIEEGSWPRARLDADYTARNTCSPAEFETTIAAYLSRSEEARAAPGARLDLVFDPETGLKLDLFGTEAGEARPLVIFIHGGYWRALSKEHSAFLAPALDRLGIALAVPDYRLAPGATMREIVADVRKAVAFLHGKAGELGLDAARIVVTGSSAGGHLAAVLAQSGWQADHGLPDRPIHGVMPVSGLFELAPIAASHVQDWMNFSPDEIRDFSPLRHLTADGVRVIVAKAEKEAEGFHRQSRVYAEATHAPLITVAGRHHFDVVFDMADPATKIGAALVGLVLDQSRSA